MTRVALIGCGDVATVHLDAIADLANVELVGVADTDPLALARVSSEWSVPGFADHRALIDAVQPDVVHICTPHAAHAPVALDTLAAGVHTLLEKPLAATLDEGRALVAAADASAARFGVCLQNRYNGTTRTLARVLASGALGPVLGARAQVMWTRTADYYEAKPWRGTWAGGGGGFLMNQAIHTIDLVQWLLGPVAQVHGSTSTLRFADVIEVEDTAVGLLRHASGVATSFYGTLTHHRNEPVMLEIACERGVLRLEGDLRVTHADGTVEQLAPPDEGRTRRSYWGASHALLIADFYARLTEPEPFWIDARAALQSLAVVQAFYDHGRVTS